MADNPTLNRAKEAWVGGVISGTLASAEGVEILGANIEGADHVQLVVQVGSETVRLEIVLVDT